MATVLFEEGHEGVKGARSVHKTKQILINIVDGIARTRPQSLYAEFPVSPMTYDAGYRKITYRALANAINGVAWWLTKELGPGKNFQTLCYMGWNDVRYGPIVLGAVKAGYKVVLTSPRNTIEGTANVFKELDCTVLLTADPQPPLVNVILDNFKLKKLIVPSVEELLTTAYPHFPYNKTFEQAHNEPLVALHTSGTTGLPKPVVYTHDWAATYIRTTQLEPPEGFESMVRSYQGTRVFVLLPSFHASSIFTLLEAIANNVVVLYPLPTVIPSSTTMAEALKHITADTAVMAPPMVAEIATKPELREILAKKIDVIFFGGGDLPQAFGDAITSDFLIYTSNGSTETAPYPLIRACGEWPRVDWKYNRIHPAAGIEYRHQTEDMWEAVIVKKEEGEQPVFKIYPDLQEYHTRDLFSLHPTEPELWTYRGRTDDMIDLAIGHKANPMYMEHAVAGHPEVRDAIMVPVGKHMKENYAVTIGLLVEMKSTEPRSPEQCQKVIDEVWTIVEEANLKYAPDARISKARILISDPSRPLPRNIKTLVVRRLALDLYAKELEAL